MENNFVSQFPHLSHLTVEQQERFLVAHYHNEKQEEKDKKTHDELLRELSLPARSDTLTTYSSFNNEEKIAPDEKALQKKKVQKVITNVVDFIPVVGSAKMIFEGVRGTQYGTETELHGKKRVIHTASGVVFFALDVTGVGAIASELGKAGIKLSTRYFERKALERVAESAVIKKESENLALRGQERVKKQEEINQEGV